MIKCLSCGTMLENIGADFCSEDCENDYETFYESEDWCKKPPTTVEEKGEKE